MRKAAAETKADRPRDYRKEFVAEILAASNSRRPGETMADCCRMMACAIWKPLAPEPEEVEREYAAIAGRYSKPECGRLANAFGILCDALEARRGEFLGDILEREFRATNTGNGQFLTPPHLARLMGDCLAPKGTLARWQRGEIMEALSSAMTKKQLMDAFLCYGEAANEYFRLMWLVAEHGGWRKGK